MVPTRGGVDLFCLRVEHLSRVSTHTQLINLCPLKMALFDEGIIAVCLVAGWAGYSHY